jgi:CPA1 family monovalent cation:H+ antiporter
MFKSLRYSVFILLFLLLVSILPHSVRAQNGGSLAPSGKALTFQIADKSDNLAGNDEKFILVQEIILGLLFIATLVGIVAQRLRVPYTIGLVLMGLAMTLYGRFEIIVTPNLILALLVPPLIFEAAFHINFNELRLNLAPILALAIPGVIITTLLVGGIVAWGAGLSFPIALVFGALVSATDPVSVVALFRAMGVPKRMQILLEGESLFNDGTAIVVFNIVIAFALEGTVSLDWFTGIADFIRVTGGGIIIGLVLGTLISQLISRIDDYLIETTLTSLLAYGSYLAAERLGVSGVLAVVAAGLVNGNIGPKGMSPTTRIVVFNFWEYVAFLANSFVFLLIGLSIDLPGIFLNWRMILWAILGVLVARAVSVYGLSWIGREIQSSWKHVLYWSGLRGAISLALALGLPLELGPARQQIQVMAFGVVLFTLLVPGFSMGRLVRHLGLEERDPSKLEYERRHARAVASRTALEHLARMNRQGLISDHTWQNLLPVLKNHSADLTEEVREVLDINPSVEVQELETIRREYLRALRSTYTSLSKDGVVSDDTYAKLVGEVDAALSGAQAPWLEPFTNHIQTRQINRLMVIVVQEIDADNAVDALLKNSFIVTRFSSTGAFLGKQNVTLLVGLREGQESTAMQILGKICMKRVDYVPLPVDGAQLPLANPIPITIGGATIFTFEVERFEVL